jgi:hypothetical protein
MKSDFSISYFCCLSNSCLVRTVLSFSILMAFCLKSKSCWFFCCSRLRRASSISYCLPRARRSTYSRSRCSSFFYYSSSFCSRSSCLSYSTFCRSASMRCCSTLSYITIDSSAIVVWSSLFLASSSTSFYLSCSRFRLRISSSSRYRSIV